jgi:hypothetical protein
MNCSRFARWGVGLVALSFASVSLGENRWGLQSGTVELQSADKLTFGPEGVLFIGDAKAATVYGVATGDLTKSGGSHFTVKDVDSIIAKALQADSVTISDMATNPLSGTTYFAVQAKRGDKLSPAIARVDSKGTASAVDLSKIEFAKSTLPNPPEDKLVESRRGPRNARMESITDLAYADGRLIISGTSIKGANVWEVPLPFADAGQGTPIEIYHTAHDRVEDNAVVRAFIPITIDGQPSVLAGFTCTPLVKFSLSSIQGGNKVRGETVAELGNRNQPLDMFQYSKGGKDYLLIANSARGVMKVKLENVGTAENLTKAVKDGGTAGLGFDSVKELENIVQLDRLDAQHGVVLQKVDTSYTLRSIELP